MRLLMLCILTAMLAGCTTDSESLQEYERVDPCVVESADDFSCTKETRNRTGAQQAHLHDYWGGQERIRLQDVEGRSTHAYCTGGGSGVVQRLRPADGDTIIQGTSEIHLTVSWDDPGQPDAWHAAYHFVSYKSAAERELGGHEEVENGATIVIASDNEMNDLPHQQLSAWEFALNTQPENAASCSTYSGTIRMSIEIVRGHDIPLYPGHPDRWDGGDVLPILEEQREIFWARGTAGDSMCVSLPGYVCMADAHEPGDGRIIPHDAKGVQVTIQYDGSLPVGVAYHGAASRELQYPEPAEEEGTTRTYWLPVDKNGDGPYALQSLWQFWAYPDHVAEQYSGSYTITVEAHRLPRA